MSSAAIEQGSHTMKLYSSLMSSCSCRVRLALHMKGLKYECINVTPLGDPELLKVNPMGYVPALVDGTTVVSDSYAILLYLDEKYPQHALLPQDLFRKTINYQVASIVSSSIQPLQNLTLVRYIGELVSPDEQLPWAQYHIRKGFVALEKLLVNYAGKYATGDEIYLADLYLAPQIDNVINRYKLDMTEFPLLLKLYNTYNETPSFLAEKPQQPSDFVKLPRDATFQGKTMFDPGRCTSIYCFSFCNLHIVKSYHESCIMHQLGNDQQVLIVLSRSLRTLDLASMAAKASSLEIITISQCCSCRVLYVGVVSDAFWFICEHDVHVGQVIESFV